MIVAGLAILAIVIGIAFAGFADLYRAQHRTPRNRDPSSPSHVWVVRRPDLYDQDHDQTHSEEHS